MPTTYPTIDTTQMELTPMIVSVKRHGALSFTNLGGTLGNVKIKVTYKKAPIKADQFGDTILDKRVSGFECNVETEMVQIRDKQIITDIFPNATLVGSTPYKVSWNTNIGDSDVINHSSVLNLHPQSVASSDVSLDWNFPVAVASADSEITFGPTEQARMKIHWEIYPDLTQTPAVFVTFGDPAIV